MAVMKNNTQSPVKPKPLPRKAVVFSAKIAPLSTKSESHNSDAMLQSSNMRRRYQRRGSKAPSMFMAGFNGRPKQSSEICLRDIQRMILNDEEFLLSLKLSEAREGAVIQRFKRSPSVVSDDS